MGATKAAGREINVREWAGVCLSCWQWVQEGGQSEGVKLDTGSAPGMKMSRGSGTQREGRKDHPPPLKDRHF